MALTAAWIANRAAVAMTYGERVVVDPLDLSSQAKVSADYTDIAFKIDNLLYNCVTNGGRDFLPDKDKNLLLRVRRAIANYVLEFYQREGIDSAISHDKCVSEKELRLRRVGLL